MADLFLTVTWSTSSSMTLSRTPRLISTRSCFFVFISSPLHMPGSYCIRLQVAPFILTHGSFLSFNGNKNVLFHEKMEKKIYFEENVHMMKLISFKSLYLGHSSGLQSAWNQPTGDPNSKKPVKAYMKADFWNYCCNIQLFHGMMKYSC